VTGTGAAIHHRSSPQRPKSIEHAPARNSNERWRRSDRDTAFDGG